MHPACFISNTLLALYSQMKQKITLQWSLFYRSVLTDSSYPAASEIRRTEDIGKCWLFSRNLLT